MKVSLRWWLVLSLAAHGMMMCWRVPASARMELAADRGDQTVQLTLVASAASSRASTAAAVRSDELEPVPEPAPALTHSEPTEQVAEPTPPWSAPPAVPTSQRDASPMQPAIERAKLAWAVQPPVTRADRFWSVVEAVEATLSFAAADDEQSDDSEEMARLQYQAGQAVDPKQLTSAPSAESSLASAGGAGSGDALVQAQPLTRIEPTYPLLSRRRGEQGVVVLMFRVTPDGRAEQVQVVESSGYSRLDQAATRAVEAARFRAVTAAGAAGYPLQRLRVRFVLDS